MKTREKNKFHAPAVHFLRQALNVLNGFSPDGNQVDVGEVERLSLPEALIYLRESKIPITFEFLA